jgi:hypothetical protein
MELVSCLARQAMAEEAMPSFWLFQCLKLKVAVVVQLFAHDWDPAVHER